MSDEKQHPKKSLADRAKEFVRDLQDMQDRLQDRLQDMLEDLVPGPQPGLIPVPVDRPRRRR